MMPATVLLVTLLQQLDTKTEKHDPPEVYRVHRLILVWTE